MKTVHNVGISLILDSVSPSKRFGAVFEDDGDTGYFYALDMTLENQQIVHALSIYDVGLSIPKDFQLELSITWSDDGNKCSIEGNKALIAGFDFLKKRFWNRASLPEDRGEWRSFSSDVEFLLDFSS